MQLWVWRQLRIELPDDWEMLQYGRDAAAGRCAFADRHQFRLEMDWRTVAARPDVARTMGDYLAKLTADQTLADGRATRVGEWPGIVGRQGEQAVARFGRYLAPEQCVVELVFLWPEARDAALEGSVLASVGVEPERGGRRRWRAFGMDLAASADLPLRECVVQPAVARMAFGRERGRREETFQRLGMVDEWLRGSVGEWLASQAPRDVVRSWPSARKAGGHAIALLHGTRRPALLRASRPYASAAWRCPRDGRLYRVATTGAARPDEPLAGGRLGCCGELELTR